MNRPQRPANSLLILILGLLSTISPLSIDMYLAAFPQMAEALHTTPSKIALSLSSYFIGLAAGQLFYGPVLDRFGRKPPLYFGLGVYALASVGCLTAHTVEALIAFRFLQALGGCAAQVAAVAMVRDFFPAKEGAKVFSLIMLVLSVSPLLAPTIGGFLAFAFGWQSVFVALLAIVAVALLVTYFFLPEPQAPDRSVSLRPVPILKNYLAVMRERQFLTYALAGAFTFAGLFVYVASSPILFMEIFKVTPQTYGAIFAMLASGFILSGQFNVLLGKRFSMAAIYWTTLRVQVVLALLLFFGTLLGALGFYGTVAVLFFFMCTIGISYPNAAALALAPFTKNIGSASAMLGFLQMGVGSLASSLIGFFDSTQILPIMAVFAFGASCGLLTYVAGRRRITVVMEHSEAPIVAH